MRHPLRLGLVVLLGALAACGKIGPPDTPPGSTYPKAYPAGATATSLISPLSDRETTNAASTKILTAPEVNGPAFTAKGSWIDPNTHRPTIDPNADLDKWHLNNPVGY
jgi:predicted small lipoprotein YifL